MDESMKHLSDVRKAAQALARELEHLHVFRSEFLPGTGMYNQISNRIVELKEQHAYFSRALRAGLSHKIHEAVQSFRTVEGKQPMLRLVK